MKPRTVIILWVIAIALGITAYFVKFQNKDTYNTHTTLKPGDKILADFPARTLTKVTLNQGHDTTTLARGKDGNWTVTDRDNYPGNHELLRNLLGALGTLQVAQGYPCTSEHFGRFGVSSESNEESDLGLRVSMKKNDNTTVAEVFLGKYNGATRDTMGRFIRITGDDSGVYATNETFPGVYADPQAWLEPAFFSISNIQSIHLTAPNDTTFNPWEVSRASLAPRDQFKLAGITDQELMKITSTSAFRGLFAVTSFQDVLTSTEADRARKSNSKEKRQAIIKTFDGLTYTITYWPQPLLKPAPDPANKATQVPPQESYLLTVNLTGTLPTSRTRSTDEKPEETKQRDQQFLTHQKKLKQQINRIDNFKGRIFRVSPSLIKPLDKTRSAFVRSK